MSVPSPAIDELIVASRAIHYAAAVVLVGELTFFACIARPAPKGAPRTAADPVASLRPRVLRVCTWSLALLFASGAAWLVAQAASMSGTGIVRALDRETLGVVLTETLFGRTWMLRFALGLAFGAAIAFVGRASARLESMGWACALLLACALLGSLAWAGHASAEQGLERLIHLAADVLHLLAAGAWLGALPALAFALRRAMQAADASWLEFAAPSVRRFSVLGQASVASLVLTGAVNAWYTVGSFPALFGTTYGRLLSAKLVLFAAMVSLAAVNRLRLAPRLSDRPGDSALPVLARLRRNAIAEIALGMAVLAIVGALGVTIPALHVQTLWPFPFTFDWDEGSWAAAAALIAACAALALALGGIAIRSRALTLGGTCVLGAAIGVSAWKLAVPAYPTTYFRSPAGYATASIARGAHLYARNCTACHGKLGHGDGPAAASLPMRPADLTEHLLHHREGELLWWIQHGISGTPMPGFGGLIAEDRLWDLINFLRAQAEAEEGKAMNPSIEPWRPIVAPDFTFQVGTGEQETLAQQRGRRVVLLVFYTLPGSLVRLRALGRSREELEHAGVRVIAVPMRDTAGNSRAASGVDVAILADFDPGIVEGYSVFRRIAKKLKAQPAHLEFLIDLQGYLRARWVPGDSPGWDSVGDLLNRASVLKSEKPHALAPARHVH